MRPVLGKKMVLVIFQTCPTSIPAGKGAYNRYSPKKGGMAVNCRIGELRNKEVVNMKDGGRLGFVSDVELDTAAATLTAVVVYGRLRLFGLLGREPDFVIPWKDIELIGDDTVLVNWQQPEGPKQSGTLQRIWEKLGM